ncbi:hypothetical protein [Actinophytocola sp.]|uniref:hypothetical protein n=1 Tax=Actinophytocola sp. TaxID=1872138 RepID=UPI003D6B172F
MVVDRLSSVVSEWVREWRARGWKRIRQRRLSFEEFTEQREAFARRSGEPGTLSYRHVQRLAAGQFAPDQLRPPTARLLERFFEAPIEELLTAPDAVEYARHASSGLVDANSVHPRSPAVAELHAVLADYSHRASGSGSARDAEPVSLSDIEQFSSMRRGRTGLFGPGVGRGLRTAGVVVSGRRGRPVEDRRCEPRLAGG